VNEIQSGVVLTEAEKQKAEEEKRRAEEEAAAKAAAEEAAAKAIEEEDEKENGIKNLGKKIGNFFRSIIAEDE
jgi:cell division protein FtsA